MLDVRLPKHTDASMNESVEERGHRRSPRQNRNHHPLWVTHKRHIAISTLPQKELFSLPEKEFFFQQVGIRSAAVTKT
jgi:hypothetical protein